MCTLESPVARMNTEVVTNLKKRKQERSLLFQYLSFGILNAKRILYMRRKGKDSLKSSLQNFVFREDSKEQFLRSPSVGSALWYLSQHLFAIPRTTESRM